MLGGLRSGGAGRVLPLMKVSPHQVLAALAVDSAVSGPHRLHGGALPGRPVHTEHRVSGGQRLLSKEFLESPEQKGH